MQKLDQVALLIMPGIMLILGFLAIIIAAKQGQDPISVFMLALPPIGVGLFTFAASIWPRDT